MGMSLLRIRGVDVMLICDFFSLFVYNLLSCSYISWGFIFNWWFLCRSSLYQVLYSDDS